MDGDFFFLPTSILTSINWIKGKVLKEYKGVIPISSGHTILEAEWCSSIRNKWHYSGFHSSTCENYLSVLKFTSRLLLSLCGPAQVGLQPLLSAAAKSRGLSRSQRYMKQPHLLSRKEKGNGVMTKTVPPSCLKPRAPSSTDVTWLRASATTVAGVAQYLTWVIWSFSSLKPEVPLGQSGICFLPPLLLFYYPDLKEKLPFALNIAQRCCVESSLFRFYPCAIFPLKLKCGYVAIVLLLHML